MDQDVGVPRCICAFFVCFIINHVFCVFDIYIIRAVRFLLSFCNSVFYFYVWSTSYNASELAFNIASHLDLRLVLHNLRIAFVTHFTLVSICTKLTYTSDLSAVFILYFYLHYVFFLKLFLLG